MGGRERRRRRPLFASTRPGSIRTRKLLLVLVIIANAAPSTRRFSPQSATTPTHAMQSLCRAKAPDFPQQQYNARFWHRYITVRTFCILQTLHCCGRHNTIHRVGIRCKMQQLSHSFKFTFRYLLQLSVGAKHVLFYAEIFTIPLPLHVFIVFNFPSPRLLVGQTFTFYDQTFYRSPVAETALAEQIHFSAQPLTAAN